MKKVIVSLVITSLTVLTLASIVGYQVYQGVYLELNKEVNSAPSWVAFIPAALLGIILAPYIVCLLNHFKSLRLIKLNNNVVTRNIVSPILIGYFLVCLSVVVDVVYLLFDAILTQKIMDFSNPAFSFFVLGIAHLFYVVPIVMLIVLAHEKKKA